MRSVAILRALLLPFAIGFVQFTALGEFKPEANSDASYGRGRDSVPGQAQSQSKSVPVLGANLWEFQGPSPALGGSAENAAPNNEAGGPVQVIVPHPTNPDILWIGTVSGTVWKTTNATSAQPTWTSLTDDQPMHRIGALALDPTDPTHNTLWAGCDSNSEYRVIYATGTNLLKTSDGGATWTRVPFYEIDYLPIDRPPIVTGLAVRGNTVVVSISGYPVVSVDGGSTWDSYLGPYLDPYDIGWGKDSYMAEDPTDINRLYSAQPDSVTRCTNPSSISVWNTVSTNNAVLQAAVANIACDKVQVAVAGNGRVYVAVTHRRELAYVGYSDNQGGTWTAMDLPRTLEGSSHAITDATNASPIVVTSTNHGLQTGMMVQVANVSGNTAANGVWRVTFISASQFSLSNSTGNGAYSSGGTWQRVTGISPRERPPFDEDYVYLSLAADPNNPNLVYIGGEGQDGPFPNSAGATVSSGRLFRGDASVAPTGGTPSPQWTSLTHNGTASHSAPHSGSRHLTFDANGSLLEAGEGGVYRRTNPQSSSGDWISLCGNLGATEIQTVAYDSLSNRIIASTPATGVVQQTATNNTTWETVSKGAGGIVAAGVNAALQVSYRYSSDEYLRDFRMDTCNASGALVSRTHPTLTVAAGGNALNPLRRSHVEVNTADPNRLVIITEDALYESLDRGNTLTEIKDMYNMYPIALDAAYGGIVNGQVSPHVLYVVDETTVIIRATEGGPFTYSSYVMSPVCVAVDPYDASIAYVGDVSGRIHQITSFGASTSPSSYMTGNMPARHTLSIATVPLGNATGIAIGTDEGVYVSTSVTPGSWHRIGTNLPLVLVPTLDYDAADDVLVVGTLGRGTWMLRKASSFFELEPRVASITQIDSNAVEVTFSREMGAGALDAANYALSGPGSGTLGIHPNSIAYLGNFTYLLEWSSGDLTPGSITVTVTNVQDSLGVAMTTGNSGTTISVGLMPGPVAPALVAAVVLSAIAVFRKWRAVATCRSQVTR